MRKYLAILFGILFISNFAFAQENEIGKVLRLNGEGAYLELPKNLLKKVEN